MINTRLFIAVGVGGSRIDFLSGWLGSLPNFIDSQWRIDVETGRSFTLANCIRNIDLYPTGPQTLKTLLGDRDIHLDPNSTTNFAVSSHGFLLEQNMQKDDLLATTIIRLDTDSVDYKKLNWEYTVKTFMSYHRLEHAFHTNEFYTTDAHLKNRGLAVTDDNRAMLVEESLAKAQFIATPKLSTLPTVTVRYEDIFQRGGSFHLASQLGITCPPVYHQLWDNNLQYVEAPKEIVKFGRTWHCPQ